MTLFDLYAKITLDSGDYEKGIDSASKKSGTLTKSLETTSNRIKTLKSQQADARKEVERLADAFNKSAKETGTDSKQTQELAKQLKDAENNVESITKEIDDYNESLRKGGEYSDAFSKIGDIGHKVFNAVKVAAVAGGAALTAFTKSSIDTGMEFDKAMSQVAATMGYSVDELNTSGSEAQLTFQSLRDAAREYGRSTAFTSTQAAEALNYMALAGYDAETSIAMLPNVLNLAAAGGLELGYASDMITDSQSALSLSLDETNALMDQMARTASISNTSVGQLGEAILTVGGTAQNMKYGTTELNAVLGVLADNHIKASEAGTHLRNILISMAKPTDDARAVMDKLGVSFFDAEGNLRSFAEIFPELNGAMADLTQEQKLQALATIFNSRDIASVQALLGTTAERWRELGNEITNSGGAMEKMAAVQLDNLAGDVTLFNSALTDVKQEISDKLNPVLRELVQRATDFVSSIDVDAVINSLKKLWESFNNLLPIIAGVTTAMIAYKAATAISSIIDALTTATEGMTIAQAALNAVLNANPFVLIVTAIGALVGALGTLILKNDEAKSKLVSIWNSIKSAVVSVFGFIKDFLTTIWEAIKSVATTVWNAIKTVIVGTVNAVKSVIENVWNGLKSLLSSIWNGLKSLASSAWEGIKNAIITPINAVKTTLTNIWNTLKNTITNVWNTLKNTATSVWNSIKNAIITPINAVKTTLTNIWNTIKTTITNVWNTLKNTATNVWNSIKNAIMTPINAVKTFLSNTWTNIKNTASNAWESIKNAIINPIKELPGKIKGIGSDIVSGLWNGIKNAAGWLLDKVTGFANGILDKVKGVFGIHSPSKVFAGIGKNMALGLGEGWQDEYRSISNDIEKSLRFNPASIGINGYGVSSIGAGNAGEESESTETVTEYNMQVTINLNGSDYTSQRQIAEEISVQLQNLVNRRTAAWA